MTQVKEDGFMALTIKLSDADSTITTGVVDSLGEDVDEDHRALLYNVMRGLSALLLTDIARIGAVGELHHMQDLAEAMQEDIFASHEEEDGPQAEIVFEAAPELEERIRKSELH
tara:strand:+ start:5531 stop:5872 length:342 start_codon:yes stop_codon:yes gene_type:complete